MLHDIQLCFMAADECKVVVNLSDEALDRSQVQFTVCGSPAGGFALWHLSSVSWYAD